MRRFAALAAALTLTVAIPAHADDDLLGGPESGEIKRLSPPRHTAAPPKTAKPPAPAKTAAPAKVAAPKQSVPLPRQSAENVVKLTPPPAPPIAQTRVEEPSPPPAEEPPIAAAPDPAPNPPAEAPDDHELPTEDNAGGRTASFFAQPLLDGQAIILDDYGRGARWAAEAAMDDFCRSVGFRQGAYYSIARSRDGPTLEDVLCLR